MAEQISDITDAVVIVAGAAGLLGKGFCRAIAGAGGTVVIADYDRDAGSSLEASMNDYFKREAALFVHTDITAIDSVKAMIETTVGKFGKVDALVNTAYPRNRHFGKPFEHVTYEDFCDNVNKHLGGYFLVTQQVVRTMMKQGYGNIVNIASIYGMIAPRFELYEGTAMTVPVEYAAIKGAIIQMTRYLASYLGPYNIRVNSISPGGIFDNQPENFLKRYNQRVVLGKRMADVGDIAGVLLFLLSDASRYMTGENLVVDGGWTV